MQLNATAVSILLTTTSALVLTVGAELQQPAAQSDDPQVRALRRLQAVSETPVQVAFENGFPRGVLARVAVNGDTPVDRARDYLSRFDELYGQSGSNLGLAVRRVSGPPEEAVLFYQTYRAVPVFAAEILVSLRDRHVSFTVGGLLTDVSIGIVPQITALQAQAMARKALGRAAARILGETTIMVFDHSLLVSNVRSNPRLVWRVTLGGNDPVQAFIDALTGDLIFTHPLAPETGAPLHQFDLHLLDAENEANAQNDYCFSLSNDAVVADEGTFKGTYNGDPDAVAAFDASKVAYAFFHEHFNRHSYDDEGSLVELFIHATVPNGSWSKDCDLAQFNTGWVGRDVVVHEFSHGIIFDTSNLTYANQPGALNESFADIMGVVADQEENEKIGTGINWTIGEDLTGGQGPRRSLSNPAAAPFNDPVVFNGASYVPPTTSPTLGNDWGGVHTNSGVPNFTAFLMAAGGTHPITNVNVKGMGRRKMRDLKWTAMTNLNANASFVNARTYEIGKALEWAQSNKYGFTLSDVCSVRNAWGSVGVGSPDLDCDGTEDPGDTDDDNDFILDSDDNCPTVANPSQKNSDAASSNPDSQGDACDTNKDNDPFPDSADNCPTVASNDQADFDQDGKGDVCDDFDSDGFVDSADNCPKDWNPDQGNADGQFFGGDALGDVCDSDSDNDGIPNFGHNGPIDNCPLHPNKDQKNTDGDSIGDACDVCSDTYQNPDAAVPAWNDKDEDGIPDACDTYPNGGGMLLGVDGVAYIAGRSLIPDGMRHSAKLSGAPGRSFTELIPVCRERCPDWFDPHYGVTLSIRGLVPTVRVRVIDDEGSSVTRTHGSARHRSLRFRPLSGRRYFLAFSFDKDFRPRTETKFEIRYSVSERE